MQSINERYALAKKLVSEDMLNEALDIYMELQSIKSETPVCYYNIAKISNMLGNPVSAYNYYSKAFELLPTVTSIIYSAGTPGANYIYTGLKEEREINNCPLCNANGTPYWCYILAEHHSYNPYFNPIRMWMYCQECHHLFARHFPEKHFVNEDIQTAINPQYLRYYSAILSRILQYGFAKGFTLFEIGIGTSECILAAKEMGYETFGIDVIKSHVDIAKNKYGLNVEHTDFTDFESDKKWDIIMMGDVLEHIDNPSEAIKKAETMLKDDGAIWISTPTFESAYSIVHGHDDPMRKEQTHINFFSRKSLYLLLEKHGFTPVDYRISGHYITSMEIIAVKTAKKRFHN
jgi:SAM-dependent methyltransferase